MKGRESEPRWSRQKTRILYKKIKHISNRKFQSKPVPMNAERFKLSKYMSFGHIRSFLAFPGDRKEKSHIDIWCKFQANSFFFVTALIIYSPQLESNRFT